jgi:hypothetical protein
MEEQKAAAARLNKLRASWARLIQDSQAFLAEYPEMAEAFAEVTSADQIAERVQETYGGDHP